jgi:hypothetical protein
VKHVTFTFIFVLVTDSFSVNQCFGGRAASIFKLEVLDQRDVTTALLPTQG